MYLRFLEYLQMLEFTAMSQSQSLKLSNNQILSVLCYHGEAHKLPGFSPALIGQFTEETR